MLTQTKYHVYQPAAKEVIVLNASVSIPKQNVKCLTIKWICMVLSVYQSYLGLIYLSTKNEVRIDLTKFNAKVICGISELPYEIRNSYRVVIALHKILHWLCK